MLVDISERKRAEERQKVMIDELNHRVKNTLATVQSIAMQTIADAGSLEHFRSSYEGRLVTLSRAHDLLTRTQWEGAALGDVLRQELDAFGPGRFTLEGPDVQLSARAALSLSMIIHELSTNTAKYGALSGAGRVDVKWALDGDALRLDWVESGGPPVETPTRRGFGTRLIERAAIRELAGSADLDFPADGLRCTIRVPGPGNIRPST
jgi:two-component sensor histidine kinase